MDRKKLQVLTQEFITSEVMKEGFKFMDLKGFTMPKGFSYEEMIQHIEDIKE